MFPNPVRVIAEFVNSVLSPVPGFLRGYAVVLILASVLWAIGSFGRDAPDHHLDRITHGVGVAASGISRLAEVLSTLILSGAIFGSRKAGSAMTTIGQGIVNYGGSLVEVEEAPIKIGALVKVHGVRIGVVGLILGFLKLIGVI